MGTDEIHLLADRQLVHYPKHTSNLTESSPARFQQCSPTQFVKAVDFRLKAKAMAVCKNVNGDRVPYIQSTQDLLPVRAWLGDIQVENHLCGQWLPVNGGRLSYPANTGATIW